MVSVVGVRFKLAGKVYYFDPAELPITAGNKVIVETVRGVEYGEVVMGPKDVEEDQVVQPLKKVIRVGTDRDQQIAAENKRREKEAFGIALKKIEAHSLDMYLVDVEYTFDGSKIIFYFTAEGRVDFRELVRDLASVFRTRIEMRQIGVRDEAKLLGGIGPCGRVLCCTSFLGDFAPVSIRMAKDQNLSLNPSKISGLCGRLMCCLRYEQETYEAAKKDPTLAPGYIPPAVALVGEEAELANLEDECPTPAIGLRNRTENGFSARISQAAAVAEPPEPRRERQRTSQTQRREATQEQPAERRQNERRDNRPQGERQPGSPSQGQPGRHEGRPQGQQPGRAQEGRRERPQEGQRDRSQEGRRERPQASRPPQGGLQQPQQRERNRPAPEAEAPAAAQAQPGHGGGSRRRRRRRGPRPEGAPTTGSPTE